jgi:biotin synthase
VHREAFDPNEVQLSTLLSVKTGGCPEDCAYCPQSLRYDTGLGNEALMETGSVLEAAQAAKAAGATRFCIGAAWRGPKARDLERVAGMIRAIKSTGMEACATLGLLHDGQAEQLAQAGLDYYNHNLDTSPEFYGTIISTRTYDDRLRTLERVRAAGMRVCCGGIIGMGESREDRIGLLAGLSMLEPHPESVPINMLVPVAGTPLQDAQAMDWSEMVRTVAAARIAMPRSHVRLSAGRSEMSEAVQALCFFAGANSIFYGDRLLTTGNPEGTRDRVLFEKLGLRPMA